MEQIGSIGAAFASLVWIAAALWGLVYSRHVRILRDLRTAEPARWPRLSVLLAARDEARGIAATLDSLLAQDYPGLEIVAVDDRSTDGTGAILDAAASRHRSVRAIHVTDLPEGWLGKVNALRRGLDVASGEWLLLTDADVRFGQGVLRRAMAHAVASRLDHLVVAPEVTGTSVFQDATNAAFGAAFLTGTRALGVSRPGSSAYVGVGGFNLVKRSALERTPGFRGLRMEILDDVGIARMLRDAGARRDFVLGLGDVRVEWYESVRATVRGLEKNLFGGVARFSPVLAAVLVSGTCAAILGPLAALGSGPAWLRVLGASALACHAAGSALLARRLRRPLFPLLLMPMGGVILAWALTRSTWVCLRNGGITWRGTFYSLAELRRGRVEKAESSAADNGSAF